MRELDALLPAAWSHGNPIDILGDATADRYRQALRMAIGAERSDGLLVIYCRQGITDPTEAAKVLRDEARHSRKPVLASWMGGETSEAGHAVLDEADIPTVAYPDAAARTFTQMWRYTYNLRALYETPELAAPPAGDGAARAAAVMAAAQTAGRTLLTEIESKQVLAAYGLPVVDTRLASSIEEAVAHAEAIGYPVVLKVHSETITHKSDVGGVALNLAGPAAVRDAFARMRDAVAARACPRSRASASCAPSTRRAGAPRLMIRVL